MPRQVHGGVREHRQIDHPIAAVEPGLRGGAVVGILGGVIAPGRVDEAVGGVELEHVLAVVGRDTFDSRVGLLRMIGCSQPER